MRALLPGLVASQLGWAHSTLLDLIGWEMVAGRPPEQVTRDATDLLQHMRTLLGDAILDYAPRQKN
ncbi:hypothetical protein [Streptacidiphilus sp. MAP5-3]|uniref:hypothetical protein n=1 Tax=unclassified Streptacidiphilus TaxID=2643834 RepID=UPI003513CCA3